MQTITCNRMNYTHLQCWFFRTHIGIRIWSFLVVQLVCCFVYHPSWALIAVTNGCCRPTRASCTTTTTPQSQQTWRHPFHATKRFGRPKTHHTKLCMSGTGGSSKTGGQLIRSQQEFWQIIASTERPVLCFFTAPWCGPCRLSIPVVKEVIKMFAKRIDSCEVCTDDLPDVASDAGVLSIPTIHLYSNGECV